jgi:hypothetical protein
MMAQSGEGIWRDAGRGHRRQSLARSAGYQQTMAACARPLAAPLHAFDRTIAIPAPPRPTPTRRPKTARRHEPNVALHTPLARLSGVDVTRIDGLEGLTAPPRIAAIGLDMRRWKTETHGASGLGCCPDHRSRGGTGLTGGTRPVVPRAADALRLAAPPRRPSHSALGAHDRRLRARLGAPTAITAMAHTRARLVYRRRNVGPPDVDTGMAHDDARFRQPRLQWLQRQARAWPLHLVPNQPVRSAVS